MLCLEGENRRFEPWDTLVTTVAVEYQNGEKNAIGKKDGYSCMPA
jgi:hypothetical protein